MPLPDPNDQLIDRMLTEILGGERPPDLSGWILRRASEQAGRRHLHWWIGGIAAALLLAAAGTWIIRANLAPWRVGPQLSKTTMPGTQPAEIGYPEPEITGTVAAAGSGAIGRGRVVIAIGQAKLALGGYARVTMTSGSEVGIEGTPRDEVVYLKTGEIVSEVESGHGTFSVRTDDALVRVTGTRFRVTVRPIDRGDPMKKQTFVKVLAGTVLVSGAWGSQALTTGMEFRTPAAATQAAPQMLADKEAPQSKSGKIKSVDAKAKTFVLDLAARPLTFTVNDKTVITLDGKESTFEAAIKAEMKAAVSYTRSGDDRIATKVEVTSAKK